MRTNIQTVGLPVGKMHRFHRRPERLFPNVVDQQSDTATTLTGNTTTAHTPATTWTTLIAATSGEVDWLQITVSGSATSGTATNALIDIGVGASTAETAIISNLPAGYIGVGDGSKITPGIMWIPCQVPKGTRISGRLRMLRTTAPNTADVRVGTFYGGLRCGSIVDTYGADTALSEGTLVSPTDTYVVFSASTPIPYQALVLLPSGVGGATFNLATVTHSLAIGAAGAEVVVATQLVSTAVAETIKTESAPAIYSGHVPAGSRISVKSSAAHANRGAIVLGIRY